MWRAGQKDGEWVAEMGYLWAVLMVVDWVVDWVAWKVILWVGEWVVDWVGHLVGTREFSMAVR